jgi:hypothetical protein
MPLKSTPCHRSRIAGNGSLAGVVARPKLDAALVSQLRCYPQALPTHASTRDRVLAFTNHELTLKSADSKSPAQASSTIKVSQLLAGILFGLRLEGFFDGVRPMGVDRHETCVAKEASVRTSNGADCLRLPGRYKAG